MSVTNSDGTVTLKTQVDTKGINTGVTNIKSQLKGLGTSVKQLGALIAGAFAVKKLAEFSRECIAAAEASQEAEAKLSTVMRQRMGATQDAIDSVKELAAEQQRIGVIEDDAQLAGAQQLATFLNTSDALKALVPAMNNLAAQQNGVNATAEDMVSIGNLMGKVMQGQTSALTRVGITFTEAEEAALKYGDETQRAAVLAQVIKNNVGDMNSVLAQTPAGQMAQLRNNFGDIMETLGAGIQNFVAPFVRYLNVLVAKLATLANAFKSFSELLTGNKASTAAATGIGAAAGSYDATADSAEGLADATQGVADATKNAAKEQKKYLSGLDEVRKYETSTAAASSGGTGGSTRAGSSAGAPVDFGALATGETALDKIDEKMQKFVENLKNAVQPTIEALRRLKDEGLSALGDFAWQGLQDFYDHFLVPVGKWTFGEGIPRFVDALNKGLMSVNWGRINEGLAKLWDSLARFGTGVVGEGLLWLWEKVLVPLGTWTLNEVVPRFLDTLRIAIDAVTNIIEALKPLWQWFWDNVLQPVARFAADAFLKAWDRINEVLQKFSDWCKEHPGTIQTITTVIASFFAAWAVVSLVSKIKNLIKILAGGGGLIGALGKLVGGFNPVIAIIGAVIAIGVLLWKNWDTIKAKAQQIWSAIQSTLSRLWNNIKTNANNTWNGIKNVIMKVWNGIRSSASSIWNGVTSTLSRAWNSAKSAASNVWNGISSTVKGALDRIATAASNVGNTIRNAFIGAFSAVVGFVRGPINSIIGLINGLISGIVSGINICLQTLNRVRVSIPSWVPGIGGRTLGFNFGRIIAPRIPYLAKGAVIPPNSPFAAVLGDQKQGRNIETPEALLRQIVREESGSGGQYRFTATINRRTLFDELITEAKLRQTTSGRNPFELA